MSVTLEPEPQGGVPVGAFPAPDPVTSLSLNTTPEPGQRFDNQRWTFCHTLEILIYLKRYVMLQLVGYHWLQFTSWNIHPCSHDGDRLVEPCTHHNNVAGWCNGVIVLSTTQACPVISVIGTCVVWCDDYAHNLFFHFSLDREWVKFHVRSAPWRLSMKSLSHSLIQKLEIVVKLRGIQIILTGRRASAIMLSTAC